jgi:hypothetical protein
MGNQLRITFRVIIFVGCAAIAIQFLGAPKYALNTFALLEVDNWLLITSDLRRSRIFLYLPHMESSGLLHYAIGNFFRNVHRPAFRNGCRNEWP